MSDNYFNTLPLRLQLEQLGKCRFMDRGEFAHETQALRGKKVVIVGCGAQGLNQGLNMRDSGLDVSYALRQSAIAREAPVWKNATENGFKVGSYEELIPTADLVCNLTPDKQHTAVVKEIMPLMKKGASLAYSHGFNIVEEGMQIRKDLTVVMVAPEVPGHRGARGIQARLRRADADRRAPGERSARRRPRNRQGLRGGHRRRSRRRAGVLVHRRGEVATSWASRPSSAACCRPARCCASTRWSRRASEPGYACKLVQYGWETITEALKHGGITNMMDRLSQPGEDQAPSNWPSS